jgi:hypothetical protein
MKKLLVFMLSVIMCFSFAACGGGSDSSDSTDTETVAGQGSLGDYDVALSEDYQILKDYDGNKCIVLTCTFTNNSDEADSFDTTVIDTAYQDGVELERAYFLDDDSYDDALDDVDKSVKSGSSIDVTLAYVLSSDTSDVELELEELLSLSDSTVTMTYNLK